MFECVCKRNFPFVENRAINYTKFFWNPTIFRNRLLSPCCFVTLHRLLVPSPAGSAVLTLLPASWVSKISFVMLLLFYCGMLIAALIPRRFPISPWLTLYYQFPASWPCYLSFYHCSQPCCLLRFLLKWLIRLLFSSQVTVKCKWEIIQQSQHQTMAKPHGAGFSLTFLCCRADCRTVSLPLPYLWQ